MVTILGGVFILFRAYLFTLAGERVVARLRNDLFVAIMRQEIGMFDVTRTGELINRLSSDTSVLKNAATTNVSMGLRWVATIIGGIIYLFVISWKLTLVMLSVVPLVAVTGRYYGTYVKSLSKKTQDALAQATEVAEESIGNVRTVRSFAKEGYQASLYAGKPHLLSKNLVEFVSLTATLQPKLMSRTSWELEWPWRTDCSEACCLFSQEVRSSWSCTMVES